MSTFEPVQPYLQAFLDVHGLPLSDFEELDVRLAFSAWIRYMHQEFRKQEGLPNHPHYTPEVKEKFVSFLRQGLAA